MKVMYKSYRWVNCLCVSPSMKRRKSNTPGRKIRRVEIFILLLLLFFILFCLLIILNFYIFQFLLFNFFNKLYDY